MIVCPVCEHAQANAGECEVCGKRLAPGDAPTPPVPVLEGLEPTLLAPADAAPGGMIPDLEPTLAEAAPLVADMVPDVEATSAAPVDADGGEPIPELERTAAAGLPDDGPSPAPAMVVCRYCRTPAMPGERICGRCGMRLPVLSSAAPRPPGEAAPVLCSCGTPVRAAMCPLCGARHATG
jgi:hypothetical protein